MKVAPCGAILRRSFVPQGAASSSGATTVRDRKRTSVLFVCLGNICRSPSAEAVFRDVVDKAGLTESFAIDSCGTGGGSPDWYVDGGYAYHTGDPADSRMMAAASTRGIVLTSRSRPLTPSDLRDFDYIVAMDPRNSRDILVAAHHWSNTPAGKGIVPGDHRSKISLMTSYCLQRKGLFEVPDPYYGGPEGFDLVLDLLDDACEGLLQHIRNEKSVM